MPRRPRRRRTPPTPGLPAREIRATRWPRTLYRLTKHHVTHGTKIPPALWSDIKRILCGEPIEDPNGNAVPIDIRTRRLFIALFVDDVYGGPAATERELAADLLEVLRRAWESG